MGFYKYVNIRKVPKFSRMPRWRFSELWKTHWKEYVCVCVWWTAEKRITEEVIWVKTTAGAVKWFLLLSLEEPKLVCLGHLCFLRWALCAIFQKLFPLWYLISTSLSVGAHAAHSLLWAHGELWNSMLRSPESSPRWESPLDKEQHPAFFCCASPNTPQTRFWKQTCFYEVQWGHITNAVLFTRKPVGPALSLALRCFSSTVFPGACCMINPKTHCNEVSLLRDLACTSDFSREGLHLIICMTRSERKFCFSYLLFCWQATSSWSTELRQGTYLDASSQSREEF